DNDEKHGDDGGEQHARAWHPPLVQTLENLRQLAVARHEKLNSDQIDNRGVDGGEQEQAEDDADDDSESVTEGRTERATDKNLAHVTQHVIAHAFGARSVDVAICNR